MRFSWFRFSFLLLMSIQWMLAVDSEAVVGESAWRSGNTEQVFYNNDNEPGGRCFYQTGLSKPLNAGERYCFDFFLRLGEGSGWMVAKAGIYFSDSAFSPEPATCLQLDPQFTFLLEGQQTHEWIHLEAEFTATGTERYFTIGCFENPGSASIINIGPGPLAEYELDDFSIRKCVTGLVPGKTQRDSAKKNFRLQSFPGTLVISNNSKSACEVEFIDMLGNRLGRLRAQRGDTHFDCSTWKPGLYAYRIRSGDMEMDVGKFYLDR